VFLFVCGDMKDRLIHVYFVTCSSKKLAAVLGLASVDELEAAIDSMDGIADDGSEYNMAREVRVRSAYLGWCKEYGKSPDESRFPTFSSNFLEMEAFAQSQGKQMALNEYADCTEAEYADLTSGAAEAKAKAAAAAKDREARREAEMKAANEKKAAEIKAAAEQRAADQKAAEERKAALEQERQELAAKRKKAADERGKHGSAIVKNG
jgi:flagellar biosynthesis GTPase FlhF